MGLKIVSFTIFGRDPKYLQGVIENAKLMPRIYPGWTMRVYYEQFFDPTILLQLGCQVVQCPDTTGYNGLLRRVLPAWDPNVERVIMRDSDSRINVREAAAVEEWIKSGKDAHTMQDHPAHDYLPIFGGMWGLKGGTLPIHLYDTWMEAIHLRRWEPRYSKVWEEYGTDGANRAVSCGDMKILNAYVWPLINTWTLRHSDRPSKWGKAHPFPPHEPWNGFVGQQVEADGTQIWP